MNLPCKPDNEADNDWWEEKLSCKEKYGNHVIDPSYRDELREMRWDPSYDLSPRSVYSRHSPKHILKGTTLNYFSINLVYTQAKWIVQQKRSSFTKSEMSQ